MHTGYALGWLLLGVFTYLGVWLSHDSGGVPRKGAGGELPIRPAWVRRILRHGDGPILLFSVLMQAFALAAIARAAVVAAGRPSPLEGLSGALLNISIALLPVGGISLSIRARRQAGRADSSSDIDAR
jgi:hypothetical protein